MKIRSILTVCVSLLIAAGCGGGGGSSGGGGATPTPQFTTTTQNAFTSFSSVTGTFGVGPQGATSSPNVPGAMFVVGNTGSQSELYKLDVTGSTVQNVTGSPFVLPNSNGKVPISNINIQSNTMAFQCAADSGTGLNTVVYLYNPSTISSSMDITPIDLSQGNLLTVTPTMGATQADGTAISANYTAVFPIGAAGFTTSSNTLQLFVGFSNPTSNFGTHNPGTILVYDVDFSQTQPVITRTATIFTGAYNPISLTVGQQLQGTRLFVVCEGSSDSQGNNLNGSLELINPVTVAGAGSVDLGATDPFGITKFSDQGDKGFITTNPVNGLVRIHEVNLDPLRLDVTYQVSETTVGSNFSNFVEVSASGALLYLQLPADRTIYIIQRSNGAVIDTVSTPTSGRATSPFSETPSYLARRAGDNNSVLFSVVGAGPNTSGGAIDVIIPTFR